MNRNRFNYTFSFKGFIIILRVNTKRSPDGCWQTAYSIIINITPHDIHFTLFYNIYRDPMGNHCSPERRDESSALHITVINKITGGKYRLYIPWEYVSNSDKDARELLISSIYKISYYILYEKTCQDKSLKQDYMNLIRHIDSIPSARGTSVRKDVSDKMKNLAEDLASELDSFYKDCDSRRSFDISTACPGYHTGEPHTGGNKKISKKLERYLLKQKEYINKLKLLRKNKLKNKVKIIKQNNLLKNLKIKIKKEKAMAKEKLKKEKAKAKEKLKKQKAKKVHITKKIKK